jgi:hypothetical protein
MIIIPPKLKILAGFRADEDVSMDQIIAALEKKQLRIPATQISNARERGAKFQRLLNDREQNLPDQSFEDRFRDVARSEEGEQLLTQMHRAERDGDFVNLSASENQSDQARPTASGAAFTSKEQAKEVFLQEVKKLQDSGITYDLAYNTAAQTQPGKSAWEFWKIAAEKEKNLPVIIRTPPQLPAAAQTKFSDYNA